MQNFKSKRKDSNLFLFLLMLFEKNDNFAKKI